MKQLVPTLFSKKILGCKIKVLLAKTLKQILFKQLSTQEALLQSKSGLYITFVNITHYYIYNFLKACLQVKTYYFVLFFNMFFFRKTEIIQNFPMWQEPLNIQIMKNSLPLGIKKSTPVIFMTISILSSVFFEKVTLAVAM